MDDPNETVRQTAQEPPDAAANGAGIFTPGPADADGTRAQIGRDVKLIGGILENIDTRITLYGLVILAGVTAILLLELKQIRNARE